MAAIVSPGGKATGKYRHHWNITDQNGEKVKIDFASVHKWETLPTNENEIDTPNQNISEKVNAETDEYEISEVLLTQSKAEVQKAK